MNDLNNNQYSGKVLFSFYKNFDATKLTVDQIDYNSNIAEV